MTRLVYIFWLLGAVLLFAAALLLVLANPDTVTFNILLPGGLLELSLGLLIGFMCALLLTGFQLAGRMMDDQMGFSLANVFDPTTGESLSVTSTRHQTGRFVWDFLSGEAGSRAVCHCYQRQHYRHLHQHAHHRCQCSPAAQSEKSDRHGNRQFEEIGGPDQGAGGSDIVWHLPGPGSGIAEKKYAVALDDDRNRDKGDQQRLRDDGLGLKSEQ